MKNSNHFLNLIFFWCMSTICSNHLLAQDNVAINRIKSNKSYKIWLYSNTGQIGKGDLSKALDDSIVLFKHNKMPLKSYAVEDLKEIRLRSKSKVAGGIILGSLTGFAIGWIAGYTQGDDKPEVGKIDIFRFTRTEKSTFFGVVGIIPGAIIGGLIGSAKITIPINGDKSKYRTAQDKLRSISKG